MILLQEEEVDHVALVETACSHGAQCSQVAFLKESTRPIVPRLNEGGWGTRGLLHFELFGRSTDRGNKLSGRAVGARSQFGTEKRIEMKFQFVLPTQR